MPRINPGHACAPVLIAASLLLFAPTPPAHAHAHLKSAQPPVDGTVHPGLQDIRIIYSEAVEPRFCEIMLTGPDGQAIAAAPPATDATDPKVLVLHLDHPLSAGTYKVDWHATATDTHKTAGQYSFTVAP